MPTQNPRKKKQSHWHKDDLALPWRSAVFPKYHLWHRYKALSVLILRLLKREPVGQKLIWKMKETGFSLCPLLNTCKMFRVVCFHNRTSLWKIGHNVTSHPLVSMLLQEGAGQLYSTSDGWTAIQQTALKGFAQGVLSMPLLWL